MGITHKVSRSSFADANANRPWQIYQDLALLLIDQARKVVHDQNDLKETTKSIYALDSTTIDLCLSLFPWADFRTHKEPANSIRLWIWRAQYQLLFIFPMDASMM
jgi:hypothetical protein